jgi:hypothetical protein
LIGVLVCLIVTACSGTGEVDPTLSPPPELTATDAPPTAVPEPDPTMIGESSTAAPEPDPTMIGESSTVVAQGAFVGADAAHQGSGSARIVRRGDGDFVLQLEDFSVTDGPDLYVYLSSSTAPGSGGALGSYVDLGLLQSATGDQTYDIPDETAVEDYASVVIYCLAYEVLFAHAPLSDSE